MRRFLLLLFWMIVTIGCVQENVAGEVSRPRATATASLIPTATSSPLPTPIPSSPTPTVIPPTVIPSPTATPAAVAGTVAVPAWLGHLADALHGAEAGGRQWQVLAIEEPLAAVRGGEAELALVSQEGELPAGFTRHAAGTRPLAVAVPFTDSRHATTAPAAADMVAAGTALLVDWARMPPRHRALTVDGARPGDAGYPLQQTWLLVGIAELNPAIDALAPRIAEALAREPLLHLAAVGDLMLDRGLGYVVGVQGNVDYPFALVGDHLRAADVTVGNLESALGDSGAPVNKSYTFQAPPAAAEAVDRAGFDVISLANNHALDYGPESLLQGIDLLEARGIAPIGAGVDAAAARAPHVVTVNGLSVAFLAYVNVPVEVSGFDTASWSAAADAPGLAWGDPATIAADVAAARPLGDHVIVVLHSGYEYLDSPSPPQMEASTAALDAGATLVIGHHAHVLQGVQFRDGPDGPRQAILYGLGNFAFEIEGDPSTAIADVWLDRRGVREISFTPAVIQFGGQPRLATPQEAAAIRQTVYRLTVPLNPQ